LANSDCESLEDPLEVSGEIEAAKSEAKIEIVRQSAYIFANKAHKALTAEDEDNFDEAFRLWNLVFNGYFPAAG